MASGSKLTYRFCPLPDDELHRDESNPALPVMVRVRALLWRETLGRPAQQGGRRQETGIGNTLICRRCHTTDRSVQRALKALQAMGFIVVRWQEQRRVLCLGPYSWEARGEDRDEAMARGQMSLPFDAPPLSIAHIVRMPDRTAVEEVGSGVLALAVGAEGACRPPTRLSGGGDNLVGGSHYENRPPEKTALRIHPPPPSVFKVQTTTCATHPEDEEDGLVEDRGGRMQETAPKETGEGHIARGLGPVAGDLAAKAPEWGPEDERPHSGQWDAIQAKAWAVWERGWDGLPPLDEGSERRQDLATLENDYQRLGAEVLEAAIRHGRAEHARGRFRLFDLRRYCAGLRSTCVAAGLAAVKRRTAERLTAAAGDDRRGWDERVKARARELRACDAGLAYSESIARAEAELRQGGRGNVLC